MSIHVRWYDSEKKNIISVYEEPWQWAEMLASNREALNLLETVNHRVNMIADFSKTKHIPPAGLETMQKLATLPTVKHPNAGNVIVLAPSPIVMVLFKVFQQLFPKPASRYCFVRDHADLAQFLDKETLKT